jgi:5'-nucleotidase
MTGAQIEAMLRQQCQPIGSSRAFLHMGVSQGFTYDLAKTFVDTPVPGGTRRDCTSVSVTNIMLNGEPLNPTDTYIVTVNNFLADGGDNFTVFRQVDPSLRVGGGIDLDELVNYFGAASPISPPGTNRVNELP